MFEAFRDFMRSIGGDATASDIVADDPRIAAAALLFHVGEADGRVTSVEHRRLVTLLAAEYGIDIAEARRLAAAGQEADRDAVDLFRFTSILMQALDERQRIHFVELLWEITFADGEVHELEDNTIWRVADLLGVSTRDRMLAKRGVAERNKVTD